MSPRISTRLLATQSDQRLLELARRGHERAFEALVHRYRRPLLRYCARMGLADGVAEEVLQQSLLRAWLALGRRVEVREPRPWLYRIVHNTAVNALRSAEHRFQPAEEAAPHAGAAVESELERRIALRDALSGVAALPHMQRQAIVLSALGGHSHEEVATVLGVSDGAVRGLLHRARTTLRGAAAALTPQPLISWACGTGAATPTAERLAELSPQLGGAGMAAVLAKGAAVALTGAVVVAGSAVVHRDRTGAHRSGDHDRASSTNRDSASAASVAGMATGAGRSAPLAASLIASTAPAPRQRGAGARPPSGSGERGARRRSDGSSPQASSSESRSDRRSRDREGSGDRAGVTGSDQPRSSEGSRTNVSSGGSGAGVDGAASGGSPRSSGDGATPRPQPATSSDGGSVADAPSGSKGGSPQTSAGDGAAEPAGTNYTAQTPLVPARPAD
ncbi:MAG TPA: sigma-70 family RNA polymerase sigma factor [Solirubrobacteraceae bacterium]